jgi:hypothetical protein
MSITAGWRFQCVNTTCTPFVNVGATSVHRCEIACLAQDQCQAASFQQATSTCQLFSNSLNQQNNLTVDVGTTTMMVISGTRMPSGKCEYNMFRVLFSRTREFLLTC